LYKSRPEILVIGLKVEICAIGLKGNDLASRCKASLSFITNTSKSWIFLLNLDIREKENNEFYFIFVSQII